MRKLSRQNIGDLVKYRGLGYSQKWIAKDLNVSPAAISYQLRQINKQAKKDGINNTYLSHFYASTLGRKTIGDTIK